MSKVDSDRVLVYNKLNKFCLEEFLVNLFLFVVFTAMCVAALSFAHKNSGAVSSAENVSENAFLSFLYKHEKKLAIAILIIGILVRVSFFWVVPDGLNQDEASMAYDAYADLTYGQDRNGDHNPVFSAAWGITGHSLLYTTLSKLFIALFGLNAFSVRAANVLFGVVAMFAFWGIVKRINKRTALISLFIFAICPWHIMMCRWGFDANIFPNVFLLGLYFLMRAFDDKRMYPVAMAVFGLSLYGYHLAYIPVIAFLIPTFVYILRNKKISVKDASIFLAIFAVLALPVAMFIIINTFDLSEINLGFITIPNLIGKYNSGINIFENGISSAAKNIGLLFKAIFSTADTLIWNTIPEFGTIYLFSAPFIVVGAIALIKRVKKTKGSFAASNIVVFMLIASVILGLLNKLNTNRAGFMFPVLIILLAEGILFVMTHFKKPAYAILPIYLCVFIAFSGVYFTSYRENIARTFFAGTGDAITYAAEETDGDIYLTEKINAPHIFALFYTKTDPQVFINTVKYKKNSLSVISFDRFITGIPEKLPEKAAFVVHESEKNKFNKNYNLKEFGNYYVATEK